MSSFNCSILLIGLTSGGAFAQSSDFTPESIPGTIPGGQLQDEEPIDDGLAPPLQDIGSPNGPDIQLDDDARDQELGLSQAEVRAARRYGMALVLGPANPWMSLGIAGYYTFDGLRSIDVSYGRGAWSMSGRTGQIEYDVEAESSSTMLGVRYHLHDSVPMFITPMVGYGTWRGKLDPSGTDDPNSLNELELLRTGFYARGAIIGASVGLTANWENGFFLEYVLINFSQAFPFSLDDTSSSVSARKQVNRVLKRPGSWGLLNLKVGYFF